jgi:hypothetical protein
MNMAHADSELFPEMKTMAGTVDYIDLKTGEVVVGDMAFQLNDRTTVRKTNGTFVSLAAVTVGAKVTVYINPEQLENFAPPIYITGIELH